MRWWIKLGIICLLLVAALGIGTAYQIAAQSNPNPWAPPVNISKSGAASQPVVAVSSDGTLHALWWDAVEGEQYARSTDITATTWTQPVAVPAIFGSRNTDQSTGREILAPPRDIQLIAGARGAVYALWFDALGRLQTAQSAGAIWSDAIPLTQSPGVMTTMSDMSGTLHLAYLKLGDDVDGPAGVYYRSNAGERWTAATLVYASPYFRTAAAQDLQISVTDVNQNVLVAWDDPQLNQSRYARSIDAGRTWSEPQMITSTQNGRSQHALVASAPNGEFLLLWQDSSVGGCGYVQRQSADGGQTWGAPERVLSTVGRCDAKWSFMPSEDGRLWLIGRWGAGNQNPNTGGVTVAMWDGRLWSESKDLTLSFFDVNFNRSISLTCLDIAIAGQTAGFIGCDPAGDVWVTRNAVELNNLIPSLTTVWSPIEILSVRTGPAATSDSPALAADDQGHLFAAWSQSDTPDKPGTALYAAVWNNGRWSNSAKIGPTSSTASADGNQPTERAEQPALIVDNNGRVHAVWSGGSDGRILHSWAYARDVGTAQGWSEPASLSMPNTSGQWPDIAAQSSRDDLYVIYAVPFNEQRGIHLAHSVDGGTSWISRTVVFDAVAANWASVDKPRLAFDTDKNVLHAVWMRIPLPGTIGSQTIYYARSVDDGQTWSAPVKVAEGTVDWPRIAVPAAGQVYLAWNQSAPFTGGTGKGVWGQYSTDGGERWSAPAAVRGLDRVGGGPIGLAVDGTGHMYIAAMGQGLGGESTLIHAKWNGQTWGEAESFRLGQSAALGNSAAIALVPQAGRLGAVLHLWMWKPDGSGQFETVASDRAIALTAPSAPVPTFTPLPLALPVPTATPAPTSTPEPILSGAEQRPPTGTGPQPLVIGGLLAVVVVVVAVSRAIWTRRY